MNGWRILAPVAALAVTGCLASKSDMMLLQDEIRTLRAMQARSDTSRRASLDSMNAVNARNNEAVRDSIRALSQRFSAFQSNVGGELYEMGRQLITIQELTGMNSKSIMQMRTSLDERAQSMAATGDAPGGQAAPLPAQLFGTASEQWRRGSLGTARAGFEELLKRYPDFDQASAAQLYIGNTYEGEKRFAEADSVYQLVVAKYPTSNDAPTALYKFGLLRLRQGKNAEAREALLRVQRQYPRSIEADLVPDVLKTIK